MTNLAPSGNIVVGDCEMELDKFTYLGHEIGISRDNQTLLKINYGLYYDASPRDRTYRLMSTYEESVRKLRKYYNVLYPEYLFYLEIYFLIQRKNDFESGKLSKEQNEHNLLMKMKK